MIFDREIFTFSDKKDITAMSRVPFKNANKQQCDKSMPKIYVVNQVPSYRAYIGHFKKSDILVIHRSVVKKLTANVKPITDFSAFEIGESKFDSFFQTCDI